MKNILIIGAGKGIGLATAQILKNENRYTISRNLTPELERLKTIFFQLDVSKDDLSELSLPDELNGITLCLFNISQSVPLH